MNCLFLLSTVVVVQCAVPYISFKGEILADHGYVDLNLVGEDFNLECHTDLGSCCTSVEGLHRGDWHFPNGNRPSSVNFLNDIYQSRSEQTIHLNCRNDTSGPSGKYLCDVPTNAVHDNDTSVRESVYVGVYSTGGNASQPYVHVHHCLCHFHLCKAPVVSTYGILSGIHS